MAKRCPEDFNPWPPFVDIFASVILVLLLFLLITIVNIGYYAQFKSVKSFTSFADEKVVEEVVDDAPPAPTVCIPQPQKKEKEKEKENIDLTSFHKVAEPQQSTESNNSLFSGGNAEGNAIMNRVDDKQQKFSKQKILLNERSMEILFENKEIFINSSIKYKIKKFIASINRISTESKFIIYVMDPSVIVSATIAKQISLGRVLNIKNIVKKSNIKSKRIQINLQEKMSMPSEYGSLLIKAYIP